MKKIFIKPIFKYIDLSTAWKAALFLGVVVYAINYSHGALAALPAALKQAAYTFFVAGFILKVCENCILYVKPQPLAWSLAIIIPSSIAISLTYLLHSFKGTPEPFHSTLPTILMAPPSFSVWAWRCKRKSHD